MKLTEEQQKILDGEKGEALQKVYRTLVMYGEIYGADSLVTRCPLPELIGIRPSAP